MVNLEAFLVGEADSASLEVDEQLLGGLLLLLQPRPVVGGGVTIVALGQGEG